MCMYVYEKGRDGRERRDEREGGQRSVETEGGRTKTDREKQDTEAG
jgi:hypothetical protein